MPAKHRNYVSGQSNGLSSKVATGCAILPAVLRMTRRSCTGCKPPQAEKMGVTEAHTQLRALLMIGE
jgi:hypothetical protein